MRSRPDEKTESRAADELKPREQLRRENGAFAFPRDRIVIDYSGRKF